MNSIVEKFYRKGKSASEIFRILNGTISRSRVFKAVKRFKETGSAQEVLLKDPSEPKKLIQREEHQREAEKKSSKKCNKISLSLIHI